MGCKLLYNALGCLLFGRLKGLFSPVNRFRQALACDRSFTRACAGNFAMLEKPPPGALTRLNRRFSPVHWRFGWILFALGY